MFQEPGGIEVVIPPTWMVSGIQLAYWKWTMHLMLRVLCGQNGKDRVIHWKQRLWELPDSLMCLNW